MRKTLALLCLCGFGIAQTAPSPAGKWVSNLKFFDQENYERMELRLEGSQLTGTLGGGSFHGTFENGRIEGVAKPDEETTIRFEGRVQGDRITGMGEVRGWGRVTDMKWEARRLQPISAEPRTRDFEPTQFQHFFSGAIEPVLHINPGDRVKTWSVDATGSDSKGVRRTSPGNPLTGPFYIEGAVAGDALAVHFTRIRLNRDTAISFAPIVSSALDARYLEQRKRVPGYDANWKIDRAAGFASLQKPTEALKNYRVPLAPMLGCVGVAPDRGMQYRSSFLGTFGGNMDYNQVREGVTVYLPVYVPGALLFVGDGHALQGAGELTQNALETSMDIEFTVRVQEGGAPPAPRFENSDYLMASGIAGSLDEAFRGATTNLVEWLEKKYGLNSAEVSSVLGTAMVYDVAEVVDPSVHVVAKVPKSVLRPLQPARVTPMQERK